MSNHLIPIAVELAKLKAVIGSKDARLVKALAKKYRKEFENIDAMGGGYDEPAEEPPRLTAQERRQGTRDLAALKKDMSRMRRGEKPKKGGLADELAKALEKGLKKAFGPNPLEGMFAKLGLRLTPEGPVYDPSKVGPVEEKEDEVEESTEPGTSMKEALEHLIMGGEPDWRVAFKYGYVLEQLCLHFGERVGDSLGNYEYAEKMDRVLKSAGVPARTLRITKHLLERGPPIPLPKIHDCPGIGYLTRAEIEAARKAMGKVKLTAIRNADVRSCVKDVRDCLDACAKSRRDLVCFCY